MNNKLKLLVITNDSRNAFLNRIITELNSYFHIDIIYRSFDRLSMNTIIDCDLVIFDTVDIEKIKALNLFFIRAIYKFIKFIYISTMINEKIEDELYNSSIDFIVKKTYNVIKVPPIIKHCINLIINDKNNFDIIKIGGETINIIKKTIIKEKEEIPLTSKEFLLIYFLYSRVGEYITRDEIFFEVWGYKEDSSRQVDHTVAQIRKITSENFIENKYKLGYKLNNKYA